MAFRPLQAAFSQAARRALQAGCIGGNRKASGSKGSGASEPRARIGREIHERYRGNPKGTGRPGSLASVPLLVNWARLFTSFRQFRNEFDSDGAKGRIANAKEGVDQT